MNIGFYEVFVVRCEVGECFKCEVEMEVIGSEEVIKWEVKILDVFW